MRLPVPKRVQSASRELNDVQDATAQIIREITRFEELSGVAARGVTLTTTPSAIAHGLGRQPIGWRVTDKTDAGDIYRVTWDDRTVTLRIAAGGPTRCDLFFW